MQLRKRRACVAVSRAPSSLGVGLGTFHCVTQISPVLLCVSVRVLAHELILESPSHSRDTEEFYPQGVSPAAVS